MAKNEKLVVGIDIGTYAIKVCQLQKNGSRYKLIAAGSGIVPPEAVEDGVLQDPKAVKTVLASLLKNLKIKDNQVGISVSGHSVIVKKINLERMEDEELKKYVADEASQYIPFDIDGVYLDFQRLPARNPDSERDDILLVAAKKEVVNEYLSLLAEMKLKTMLVDVDGFALNNAWLTNSLHEANAMLVDIGASKMNINILAQGVSVLARDVMMGSEQLTSRIAVDLDLDYDEAEKIKLGVKVLTEGVGKVEAIFSKICSQWVAEIKKAADLYGSNHAKQPLQGIVISGGGAKVDGLVDLIMQETQIPTQIFNPFERIDVDLKKMDRQYLEAIAPEMAIATGLAIRPAII